MSPASAFRSAWSDPEYVRLSSFMSWWRWDSPPGVAQRGPLTVGQDPWRDAPFRRCGGGTSAS